MYDLFMKNVMHNNTNEQRNGSIVVELKIN